MEQIRDNGRRNKEKTRDQKDNFILQNWPQKILIFLKQKNRDGDEEKKSKEEVWKQRDQDQKRERR